MALSTVSPPDICILKRLTLFDRPNFRSGDTGPAMRSHCRYKYIHPHALVTAVWLFEPYRGLSDRSLDNKATPAMRGDWSVLALLAAPVRCFVPQRSCDVRRYHREDSFHGGASSDVVQVARIPLDASTLPCSKPCDTLFDSSN